MKKNIKIVICFFVFFFFFRTQVFASKEFNTDINVTYRVNESGVTEVINKITLTNVFSNLYSTSYSIILDNIDATNIKVYGENNQVISSDITIDNSKTTIKSIFSDALVGKNKSRIFYISYEEKSFAVRTGEVWEVSIPRLSEDASFSTYYINIEIPQSFGQEAYVSPTPREKIQQGNYTVYKYNKSDMEKSGITAGFGQFQVFTFNLNYHLENPLSKDSITEITLPPDTAFQKMYYTNINPRPTDITIDSDGNWIASYKLKARERVDVVATGYVQIFVSQRPYAKPSPESLHQNLSEQPYWEVNDSQIIELAKKLKTPEEIYNFVSTKLKYDYERVKPNVERLGALNVLNNPNSAICMEFTDLFIALARSVGIPAREVNGFAYTENPQIQPLSLVNDVLHAWPEYYDKEKGAWIPVDPTWGSTTGGVDFFNKLDLRHFTFVIHGKSSTKPYPAGSYKLGTNPEKDVFVSFGSLPIERTSKLTLEAKLEKWVPLISNRLDLTINNPGPVALYNISPKIYFDNTENKNEEVFDVILPFQSQQVIIDIPFSFLGRSTPDTVKIIVDQEIISVSTNKTQVIILNLLFIFAVSIIIIVSIMFRLKKWKLPKKLF